MLRDWWTPNTLAIILNKLCRDPDLTAIVHLATELGLPKGDKVAGDNRIVENPHLCIRVIPRRVKWETGLLGCIEYTTDNAVEFSPRQSITYTPGVTVGKILAILLVDNTDVDLQTFVAFTRTIRQKLMGAKVEKGCEGETPVDKVIRNHPKQKKHIQNCMKKWYNRTTGKLRPS